MRIHYRPDLLEKTEFFSVDEIALLNEMVASFPLDCFVKNNRWKEESALDFVYTSAQIEGNQYTLGDTIKLLEEGKTAGDKSFRDATMIVNLRAAYNLILARSTEIMSDPFQAICSLHKVLMRGLLDDQELGAVRLTRGTLIGGTAYMPISGGERLRKEMEVFLDRLSTIEDPFSKSFYAFANIPYLQYFEDGNKRTSRCFSNAILMASGMPPILFPATAKNDYLEATVLYYETGDPIMLKSFVIQAYRDSYGDIPISDQTPIPAG